MAEYYTDNDRVEEEYLRRQREGLRAPFVASAGIVLLFVLILEIQHFFSLPVPDKEITGRISGVTRILMSAPHRYTYFTDDVETPQVLETRMDSSPNYLYDVPKQSKIWISYVCPITRNDVQDFCSYTIHLHSIEELQGGSWNHGKFGQGQITVLQ